MAIYSTSNNWILSLKVFLISTGVVSMAVVLKLSLPVVADFAASEVPSLWSVALSWLRPPYLYILINCIILSIVASSKFHHNDLQRYPPVPTVKVSAGADPLADYAVASLTGYGYEANAVAKAYNAEEAEGLQRKDSLEVLFSNIGNEKPPISARSGHRKAVKASPEGGKPLGVSKPKRQETLESTWKAITEGRSKPLTRHLKKSDTWESHARRNENTPTPPPGGKPVRKSDTFNDRSGPANGSPLSRSPGGSGELRKEPSLSQDELNRRVEAFIKKFNEEMRLQRQESLNQYQQMISGGAH